MKPTRITLIHALFVTLTTACDVELGSDAEPSAEPSPRSKLAEDRALTRAPVDHALHEQLAAQRQLLVDSEGIGEVDQIYFALFSGTLAEPPARLDALRSDPALRGQFLRATMLGGVDSSRAAVFDDVAAGSYTVCMSAGPAPDPELAEVTARAVAAYEAGGGGPLTTAKMHAAVAQARAETGYERRRIDWSKRPVHCRPVAVTGESTSRVAVIDITT